MGVCGVTGGKIMHSGNVHAPKTFQTLEITPVGKLSLEGRLVEVRPIGPPKAFNMSGLKSEEQEHLFEKTNQQVLIRIL
jgi:hypothetical protein